MKLLCCTNPCPLFLYRGIRKKVFYSYTDTSNASYETALDDFFNIEFLKTLKHDRTIKLTPDAHYPKIKLGQYIFVRKKDTRAKYLDIARKLLNASNTTIVKKRIIEPIFEWVIQSKGWNCSDCKMQKQTDHRWGIHCCIP